MAQEYLVLISIGPVQEFIASARKLRDLWFGSHLLSELSRTVARSLVESGAEPIFPAIQEKADLQENAELSVANKILVEIETQNPGEIIQKARKAWRAHLDRVAQESLETIQKKFRSLQINEDMFLKQAADFGEFFASYAPIENGNYAKARQEAESLLSGRKNLRAFMAPTWQGAGIRKNSLDGTRECVTGKEGIEFPGLLKKTEKLDAIGCIKRFYPLQDKKSIQHFDDLSSTALVPYRKAIAENGLQEEEAAFLEALGASGTSDREIQKYTEDYYKDKRGLEGSYQEQGKTAWKHLSKILKKLGEPSRYACILVGDGDKMGVALDKIQSADGHRIFSRGLAKFAGQVEDVIKKHNGSLIYSGGDDVMAYLPLPYMLDGADAVRRAFSDCMKEIFASEELQKDLAGTAPPTFSIGVAIVHHNAPLDQALQLARLAEQKAKTEGGRNALAILQSKRSGSDFWIVDKWEEEGKRGLVERLQSMCAAYKAEAIPLSASLGYQLHEIARQNGNGLQFEMEGGLLVPGNAPSALVLRLLEHKASTAGKGDTQKFAARFLKEGQSLLDVLAKELRLAKQIVASQNIRKKELAS